MAIGNIKVYKSIIGNKISLNIIEKKSDLCKINWLFPWKNKPATYKSIVGATVRKIQPMLKAVIKLIRKDPEIFTKAQILSSVGFGAEVGLNPTSNWNNP